MDILVPLTFLVSFLLNYFLADIFGFQLEKGRIIDIYTRDENICWRYESFIAIINFIEKKQLFKLGEIIGNNFGEQINKIKSVTINGFINKWQKGEKSTSPINILVIQNSFAKRNYDSTNNENKVCEFFKGYLKGVINIFYINKNIKLKGNNCNNCDNYDNCSFDINIIEEHNK